MLQCRIIPVTPYQQNCSVIWCDQTSQAAVIDPGGDLQLIEAFIKDQNLTLEKIFLTHGHLDHAAGTSSLAAAHKIPIIGPHRADKFWIDALPEHCRMSGFPACESFTPDTWLNQGDTVSIGKETLQVFHCPGHTPGHVIFYYEPGKIAFVGDVLFQGSIGRTDFPQGDYDTLIQSIKGRLWPLGDDVRFVPGHGPMSTFGHERTSNPFVADHRYR